QVPGLDGEVAGVYYVGGDEGFDVDGFFVGGAELLDLLGLDDNVLALGELVAADDFVGLDFAVNGAGLLVVDPAVAVAVELVEGDAPAGRRRGGVGFDGNGD